MLCRIKTASTSAPRQPLTVVIIIPAAEANSSTLLSQVTEGPDLGLGAPNTLGLHLETGSVARRSEPVRQDCNDMLTCLSSVGREGGRIFYFPPWIRYYIKIYTRN